MIRNTLLSTALLLLSACSGGATPKSVEPGGARAATPEAPAPAAPATPATPKDDASTARSTGGARGTPSIDVSAMPLAEGATAEVSEGRVVTHLKTSDCIHTTATPLVIGDQIVFGTHKRAARAGNEHCKSDQTPTAMYAVSAVDGSARVLVEGADAEATAVFAEGGILMPMVGGGGGIATWHSGRGGTIKPVRMGMDSAPLWDPIAEHFIVGTVNSPSPMCNHANKINPNCGLLVALARDGTIQKRADINTGFRAWVAAGPTTDGSYYYVGGGSGKAGVAEDPASGSCDVVKFDRSLNVVKKYNDGIPGCRNVGMLKSAPIGEIPAVGGKLYAQYLGATQDGTNHVPFAILDAETMEPVCRAEIGAPGQRSLTGFYIGPVVDEQGSAYLVSFTDQGRALVKVDKDCRDTVLAKSKTDTWSSPTLADDKYVLVADAGTLYVLDRNTGRGKTYALGSSTGVVGGVVISEYGVTVVSQDGTVTTLKDTGIKGYGSAPWPRFRKDNLGGAGAY